METTLDLHIPEYELNLNEYQIFRRDRTHTTGGGVLIGIKKTFESSLISKGKHSETVFVKVKVPKKPPIILCCAYRAPDLDIIDVEKMCTEISEIKSKFKSSIFWLCGDFNLPDIDWDSNTITGHQYSLAVNQSFLDLFSDLGLTQTVKEPTREDNILDLFLTNNNNLIKSSSVVSGTSDHHAVVVESKVSIKPKKPIKRTIRLWNKVNLDNLKKDALDYCLKFKNCYQNKPVSDINDMWLDIKENLLNILECNVPTKITSTKYYHPWITAQTKRLIRNKNIWYQKAVTRNDLKTWKKYSEYKRLVQKSCRKAHDDYVKDLITVDKSNKNFWSYIKSQRKENTGVSDLVDNNKLVSTPKEKADILNNQFSKGFSQPCNKTYKKPDLSTFSETLNSIKVSPNGVLKLMENINDRKATGPDDIPGKLLKICSFELHEIFVILFQQSLDLGTIPDDWKSAHIFPLYKKGDRTYPVNYRPISLTCVPCKLLEHIVFSTSSDFLDRQNFFTSFQHGFRQKKIM